MPMNLGAAGTRQPGVLDSWQMMISECWKNINGGIIPLKKVYKCENLENLGQVLY